MKTFLILPAALVFALSIPITAVGQETIQSRIGALDFTHGFTTGYPTDETVAKLFDELDFQQAV